MNIIQDGSKTDALLTMVKIGGGMNNKTTIKIMMNEI